ncbi:MAG TPA: cytochrome C [Myxococcota bacterium]|nr:cytochrome C [Myxococcota bacterium]
MTVSWLRRRAAISILTALASPSLAADTDSADTHMLQSPGLQVDRGDVDWGLGPNTADELPAIPAAKKGDRTPFDIYRYAGKAGSSFGDTSLPLPFADWVRFNVDRKPELMRDVRTYMASRYAFSGEAIPGAAMSGGKRVMAGPVARLPEGARSWEALSAMSPQQIRDRDVFPYKPLAHPLATTAHMVFPDSWTRVHPEHVRMDMDHDFPDAYLPEFPPPMFLTTHKELGDVTRGQEITLSNYYAIFDGLLTGEQMDGLKELLRPTATTWFNHTTHRITEQPSAGVACFSCHVNGHTNGAFELAPDSRPNQSRLRVDTPTMRGNFNMMQLSSKRSIRSMDHFSEVEEYFDGDAPSLGGPIGLANRQRVLTNRMGDFNAVLDNPPAPKLGPLMRLDRRLATEQELRGEELFHGRAQCSTCHYGPQFTDDYMHDLQVERFYVGRPEGPIKTFGLRGIKDSPPYLHDGRLPTLHDSVEFFNLVFELGLTPSEKDDLVAYLICL